MSKVADTSIEAFERKIESGTCLTDRQRCFKIIRDFGPITMEEMEVSMGKNKHTFTGRIKELKDNGIVEKVGVRDGHQLLDLVEQSSVECVDKSGDEFVSMSESLETGDEDVSDLIVEKEEESETGEVIWG